MFFPLWLLPHLFVCLLAEVAASLHVLGETQRRLLAVSVSQAVATGRGDWQKPKKRIVTKHAPQIAREATIICKGVITNALQGLLTKLDGGHRLEGQPNVKTKEEGDQNAQEGCKGLSKEQRKHSHKRGFRINVLPYRLNHGPRDDVSCNDSVEKEQEEKLVIVKANTVVDPRAVVIHFEDAHSTYAAMVASVWLILCAPFAMASFSRAFGLRRSYSKWIRTSILRHILPQ